MKEPEIMLGVPDDKMIELMEHRAMIYLPEDAVNADIEITVFHEGKLEKVHKTLSMQDLREAFRKADDGYIDEDDVFVLTDKGRAMMGDQGLD